MAMNSDEVETLERHAAILRSIWMMSERRPLNTDERRMLMGAIEAIDAVVYMRSD
jgi:RNA polymerase-interacting CarD/CdnL/TRCF family regulator